MFGADDILAGAAQIGAAVAAPINPAVAGPGKTPVALQSQADVAKLTATAFQGVNSVLANYFQFMAAEQMAKNQPVHVPGPANVAAAQAQYEQQTNWTPWIVGGLAVVGVVGAIAFFSRGRR